MEQQYSKENHKYRVLLTVNKIGLTIFLLALFIVRDESERILCVISSFFCIILYFLFRWMNEQHELIQLQQQQINELLNTQQLKFSKEQQSSTAVLNKLLQEDATLQDPDLNVTNKKSVEIQNEYVAETQSLAQSVLNVDQPEVFAESNQDKSDESTLKIQSELPFQDANRKPDENQHILHDLKGMTSLWSAFKDWFKGGNTIVRVAIIILLIGVILLLRFASEYWQPTLGAKMAGIAISGTVMTVIGYRLRIKRFGYAISLQGAGLGILFLVLFSAFKLEVVTSILISYGSLCILLALTLWLALKQNALILAFVALSSGFIAPFILNTGNHNIPSLFIYYLALNFALAIIAFYKPWRILNTVSLFATFGIGGVSIWVYAQPIQFVQLSILVWLHFALYLFISIRYSLNISQYKIAFKNIPLIDTALIFATPFMAFTLYAGLVYHQHQQLSLASAILALVYFVLGYFLHKKYQKLTLLIQSFYGLGLTFFALILPFALNAQWTSTGWSVQALALIWIGSRHQLKNSIWFGLALLGLSTLFWLKNIELDQNINLLAVVFLSLVLIASIYIFQTLKPSLSFLESNRLTQPETIDTHPSSNVKVLYPLLDVIQSICFIVLQGVVLLFYVRAEQHHQFYNNAILMIILTIATAFCAFKIGQKKQRVDNVVQLFIGTSLFYFALIPYMLWQANVIAIWWALQSLLMIVILSYYPLLKLRIFSCISLLITMFAVVAVIWKQQNLHYIITMLFSIVLVVSAYYLHYVSKPIVQKIDQVFSNIFIYLSFIFVLYPAFKIFSWIDYLDATSTLIFLLWWGILSLIYKIKKLKLDKSWLILTIILLFYSATELLLPSILRGNYQLWYMDMTQKIAVIMSIGLWNAAFIFILKEFKAQTNKMLEQGLMLLAIILSAFLGGVLAWSSQSFIPMTLFVPVLVLLLTLKWKALYFLQEYWRKNFAIALLGLLVLWGVSLFHDGHWNLVYITLFNPLDILSITIFILLLMIIRPLKDSSSRALQIGIITIIILTVLMLISSIMLRSMHHYFQLPYWSIEAWKSGTVQAGLTILWVIFALVLTTVASKKALRYVWMLGVAVLALVIVKLIFLDLSHTHTITRIISFIGSGLVMLVIGYFTPLPPEKTKSNLSESNENTE